ncbi:hypothetical protein, partial [Paenibacillus sp. MDMC362]|uniref:hypothetical protein n=1 Tax=Paenibacillus sp. MDMC362 TaxID=2977365 RepID=UPI000DC3497B
MNIFDIQKEVKGSDREAAGLSLLEQTLDFIYPATLRAAALLGVADHLVDGPKTIAELAQATET